jgi:hypothetical protein
MGFDADERQEKVFGNDVEDRKIDARPLSTLARIGGGLIVALETVPITQALELPKRRG